MASSHRGGRLRSLSEVARREQPYHCQRRRQARVARITLARALGCTRRQRYLPRRAGTRPGHPKARRDHFQEDSRRRTQQVAQAVPQESGRLPSASRGRVTAAHPMIFRGRQEQKTSGTLPKSRPRRPGSYQPQTSLRTQEWSRFPGSPLTPPTLCRSSPCRAQTTPGSTSTSPISA